MDEFLQSKLSLLTSREAASKNSIESRDQICAAKPQVDTATEKSKEEQTTKSSSSVPIYTSKIEELKTRCLLHNLDQDIVQPLHEPKSCPKCRRELHKLSREEFISRNCHHLTDPIIETRAEERLIFETGPKLIADIINSTYQD